MNLEEKKKSIINSGAFDGTSFFPEKQTNRWANDFEETHNEIAQLCEKYGVDPERMQEKFYNLTMAYLYSHSNVMSTMITGRSNFPVARNNKRSDWAMNHLNRLVFFTNNIERTLQRITRKKETQEDKKSRWELRINELKKYQENMKSYNKMVKKDPQGAYDALDDELKKEVDTFKRTRGSNSFPSFRLTNNLATIKRLEEQVKRISLIRTLNSGGGFDFIGGRVEFDAEEIRYNIFFDEKPCEEIREKIKRRGFKWSPRREAWTRGAKTISQSTIKELLK